MKTYKDCLKEHGWKQGLWADPFRKLYISDLVADDEEEYDSSEEDTPTK